MNWQGSTISCHQMTRTSPITEHTVVHATENSRCSPEVLCNPCANWPALAVVQAALTLAHLSKPPKPQRHMPPHLPYAGTSGTCHTVSLCRELISDIFVLDVDNGVGICLHSGLSLGMSGYGGYILWCKMCFGRKGPHRIEKLKLTRYRWSNEKPQVWCRVCLSPVLGDHGSQHNRRDIMIHASLSRSSVGGSSREKETNDSSELPLAQRDSARTSTLYSSAKICKCNLVLCSVVQASWGNLYAPSLRKWRVSLDKIGTPCCAVNGDGIVKKSCPRKIHPLDQIILVDGFVFSRVLRIVVSFAR